MLVGDVVNDWRRQINEPNTNRFTVQDSLDFFMKAQRQLMFELDFPEATYTITTVAGQSEYAMIENYKVLRVYAITPGGVKQILFGTNIGIMEGDITESYDGTSGRILGNPVQTPQWLADSAQPYPITAGGNGGYANTTGKFQYNDPPRYYMRGGNIGVVPTPTVSIQICIDYLPMPPTITDLSELSIFPQNCQEALVFKMCQFSRMADNSSQAVGYSQMYDSEIKEKLRPWKDSFQATKPKKFIPVTMRRRLRNRYFR